MANLFSFKSPLGLFTGSLCLALLLSGCSGHNGKSMKEAEEFVNKVKSAPAPPVPPIPEFAKINSPTSAAAMQRNPFSPEVNPKQKQPDSDRAKEPLEAYSLEQLQYVGVIFEKNLIWALIKSPDGTIYKIKSGNYLGQNYGKVLSITPTSIQIEEVIPDGLGGWTQHPNTLLLTTTPQDQTP